MHAANFPSRCSSINYAQVPPAEAAAEAEAIERDGWKLPDSIFAPRPDQCDSKVRTVRLVLISGNPRCKPLPLILISVTER